MNKTKLFNTLRANVKMPTPSRVALEIMRLCYSDDSSLQDIAQVVETDPALSAELIKFANSPLITTSAPVASVRRAAVTIGMKGIVNLALGFSLLSQNRNGNCPGFDYPRFWAKSLAQAVAGRALAANEGIFDADEIFTCGLLSHVGELAFATAFSDQYAELLDRELSGSMLLAAEQIAFGLDHHELAAELFADWGIPKKYCLAVRFHEHYRPEHFQDDETEKIAELLHLALLIANICMLETRQSDIYSRVEVLAEERGIPTDTFSSFFNSIVRSWQEWGNLFNLRSLQCPLYSQLKTGEADNAEEQQSGRKEAETTVLAVDDDPLTLLNLTRMLDNGQRCLLTADDGEEALQIVLDKQPDMVITDWHMPRLSGLDLCRMLRRTSVTQHLYIIMLTGNEADDELVRAFDAGADDYVVKPFTPKVLEARIRSGERIIKYQRTIGADRELIQKYANKLAIANRRLQTMAMTDSLTELPNRRSAMARMKDVVAEAKRFNERLSCILIDIDKFKAINDSFGHHNGDIVLRDLAGVFRRQARAYDTVSRIGGEEFLIISLRTKQEDVLQLAERLRATVEAHEIRLSGDIRISLTISLGVATWSEDLADESELINAADKALYRAKNLEEIESRWPGKSAPAPKRAIPAKNSWAPASGPAA